MSTSEDPRQHERIVQAERAVAEERQRREALERQLAEQRARTVPAVLRRVRKTRWFKFGLPIAVVVVAAAIALPTALTPGPMTLHGSITVVDTSTDFACPPGDGYSDITSGVMVTVIANDETVATGSIDNGATLGSDGWSCTMRFTVEGIPRGAGNYGVTVSHRGTLMFSEKQIENDNVSLSLGD